MTPSFSRNEAQAWQMLRLAAVPTGVKPSARAKSGPLLGSGRVSPSMELSVKFGENSVAGCVVLPTSSPRTLYVYPVDRSPLFVPSGYSPPGVTRFSSGSYVRLMDDPVFGRLIVAAIGVL